MTVNFLERENIWAAAKFCDVVLLQNAIFIELQDKDAKLIRPYALKAERLYPIACVCLQKVSKERVGLGIVLWRTQMFQYLFPRCLSIHEPLPVIAKHAPVVCAGGDLLFHRNGDAAEE